VAVLASAEGMVPKLGYNLEKNEPAAGEAQRFQAVSNIILMQKLDATR